MKMLAAFHDPDHVDPRWLRLPFICVLNLKLHKLRQAPGFGFRRRHARLHGTDGDACHLAIELICQP
jgi:hypothetical protein